MIAARIARAFRRLLGRDAHEVERQTRVGDVLLGMRSGPNGEPYRTTTAVVICRCRHAFAATTDAGAERMHAQHARGARR